MFTDIEGSTRLLHELGDAYAEILAEHRRLLRGAFAAHGGVEVDTQGDAFFYAFARAPDALAAAQAGQAALEGGPVRVRMGLHAGEPTVTDEGYVGVDVHLGARVMAAGYGGQILLSGAVARHVDRDGLRALGEHRLKDIERPVELFQVGRDAFPPLKTLNNSNVPVPATPLLGREEELADALRLLRVEDVRLVTVTGPGGSGKTRFALEAARESIAGMPHGVWFVSLAAVRDPALVVPTIASTLGVQGDLRDHLGDKRLLLVLDNFEQVAEAAPAVGELLAGSTGLQALVTSREPLRIAGEHELPLHPLVESQAVELFRQRATAVRPDFDAPWATLSAIVGRLDGLPLALELAAARVRALSADDLLERLHERLPVLTSRARDLPARQRTLRATIEWSYDLLEAAEQRLFVRLAAFAGSFDLEAARGVAGASLDDLEGLIEKSLLRRWESGRLGMLETIREYAEEALRRSDERDAVLRCHAEHYLGLALSANLSLEALGRGPQRHELVIAEQHNLRAAIDWATAADVELGLRLAVALENFWITHDPSEGARRLSALLAHGDRIDPLLRARALRDLGGTLQMSGDHDAVDSLYREALELFRAAGDEVRATELVFRLGVSASFAGDQTEARRLWERCLVDFRRVGDPIGELQALGNLGWLDFEEGNRGRGWELTQRSLEMARDAGWWWWVGGRLAELAERSLEEQATAEAERYALDSLEIAERTADREATVAAIGQLAWAAALRGDAERACALWSAVELEEARTPMARWDPFRDRYASHIPDGPKPDGPLTLGEAADVARSLHSL